MNMNANFWNSCQFHAALISYNNTFGLSNHRQTMLCVAFTCLCTLNSLIRLSVLSCSNSYNYFSVGGTRAVFGKSSLKHSKCFRFLLSNQETARALTSTPKLVTAPLYVILLSNFVTKFTGADPCWRRDFAFNWYFNIVLSPTATVKAFVIRRRSSSLCLRPLTHGLTQDGLQTALSRSQENGCCLMSVSLGWMSSSAEKWIESINTEH